MHETAIAESIVRTILENARQLQAKPLSAQISCGQFNTVNDELMQTAFQAAAAGTLCEGMTLTIRHIPLQACCRQCKTVFEFDVYKPVCTACGGDKYDFKPDAPLLLETIEFEDNAGFAKG
ncbi:MAG TPA: hydrogenase maturation nickel metallochaperone HypA [Anaerohalosphaeraceae bacterium]|nr:hydrogenase maturation nickel metallochaperone HypA [Phycisphaerae bacterium]HOK95072.1 hydrogenase maturation nickel metallochaperone HypA [Anaerohalosphaeraceae bacterium]HOL31884.1 hydrogenase maturation nickel metallochaperone HypA [Anaerohalosphaeraceae bacterium]HOM75269.1 hydrogenase maturation nickel metallochaperone HypA [Anaerohalosphaeraceae bacterium]HPC65264.1 hydrogenase maturation nickel metallochaperone HypA [Anaerohalosphaeraceae bacterium]